MAGLDEDALICDFAETYHVYDWRALPARTAATLAMGLGPDSRIMQKISGSQLPIDTMLLAMITDAIRFIAWTKTKDAERGRNRPKSVVEALIGKKDGGTETAGFDSGEDFMHWRAAMMEG